MSGSQRGDSAEAFVCCREEVSLLERNKYKFSPLALPEEMAVLFHGETLPFVCSNTPSDLTFQKVHNGPAAAQT